MMKYDFDTVTERRHSKNPVSYSMKWMDGPDGDGLAQNMGMGDTMPEGVISMFTADMDFQCAPEITEALVRTAQHGIFGYSLLPEEYYNAVSSWYADRYDWHFGKEDMYLCTTGTHTAIVEAIRSFTEPGDGVIVLLPCYSYHGDIEPNDRGFVGVQMNNDNGYYTVDFDAFEAACAEERNKMFLLCQPHNPSGRVFTEEELKKLGEICHRHNVLVASDEVHIDLTRNNVTATPAMKACGTEGVISFVAVNKTFNLAGLAMTNTIICDPALRAQYKGNPYPIASPFGISAVIAAYTQAGEWVDELNTYLDENIAYAAERIAKDLPKAKMRQPEGTYIIWIDFSGYGMTDEVLNDTVAGARVMLSGGKGFDEVNGDQYKRMILATPRSVVAEAFDRLAEAFAGK